MYKRVISLVFVLLMLTVIPLCSSARSDDGFTDAGKIILGTAKIGDEEYDFIYAPSLTVNKNLAAELGEKFGDDGALFAKIKFDFEILNRQSVFIVCDADGEVEYLAARGSLEQSFLEAFPEYSDAECKKQSFSDSVAADDSLELDAGRSNATVMLDVKPEYVEREINGEVYQVLMVGSKQFCYSVSKMSVELFGAEQPVKDEPEASDETEPEETAATTTAATTTTSTAAVTTTAAATAAKTTTTTDKKTTTTSAASTSAAAATTTRASLEIELDETGYVITNVMNLRVRQTPSLDSAVIATLPKGTQVKIIGALGMEWYKIRLEDGRVGYCYAAYIEVK